MEANRPSGAPLPSDSVDKLRSNPQTLRQEAHATVEYQQSQEEARARRHAELLSDQSLRPMTVNKVSVHGGTNLRRGFLDPIFNPLVSSEHAPTPSTVGAVRSTLQEISAKLSGLQILRQAPEFYLNTPSQVDPSTTPTDIDIDVVLKELPRFKLQTGTDVGNGEGSAYGSLLWRNMFGGAEELTLNAKTGTRTRSAYSANLSGPVFSDPSRRVSLEALSSAVEKPWASHEEVLKGGTLRYSWFNMERDQHSVEYTGAWRQVTGLGAAASATVRADAGDSVKIALRHSFHRERRDNPLLPQSGYVLKTGLELAGFGPLGGDVSFTKGDVEVGGALPITLPGQQIPSGISVGGGFRLGMLYPLPLSWNPATKALPSRLNDRFQLGGPTDVRGFQLGGIGPHDGQDSVGGDVFAAGGVNLLLPIPRKGTESSFRFQVFANGGRLVALRTPEKRSTSGLSDLDSMEASAVSKGMLNAALELLHGAPSMAAGVGLVYAHPVARFELNFSLPLVLRRGEVGTKGLQLGVGINFL